jgi:membrane-associated HD superfamily phosphohydrolase
MAQHHGARLIHFFYNKAQDCRRRAGRDEPDPEAFRYPGPRPQTREAALVMLADTAEAACRALDNPTPARIKGVVQTEINKIFSEGQLNECDLTLKDLHQIAKSFNNILIGIFHQRVEYPAGEEKAGKRNGDNNRQPGGSEREAPERASGQDRTDLKRLGML